MRNAAAVLGLALLAAVPAATGETLAIDTEASRVRIRLSRAGLMGFLGHDHEIAAPLAEGRIEIVQDDPARSSVRLRYESRRLAVVPGTEPAADVPKVEARMRGPEVLDVERFPTISFESTAVSAPASGPEGSLQLRVRGALELKGRRVEVEIPVAVRRGPDGLSARGEARLELRALGIEPPSVAGVVKVANRFRIEFELRAR